MNGQNNVEKRVEASFGTEDRRFQAGFGKLRVRVDTQHPELYEPIISGHGTTYSEVIAAHKALFSEDKPLKKEEIDKFADKYLGQTPRQVKQEPRTLQIVRSIVLASSERNQAQNEIE